MEHSDLIGGSLAELSPGESGLLVFARTYRPFHGYFSVVWCSMAVVLNVLTIMLLQHNTMKSTTNFLLCCTSMQQLMLCMLYLIFALVFYVSELSVHPDRLPYEAAVILYVYVILSTLANTILMWCTVTVAGFRLICIIFPYRPELCTMQRARLAVLLISLSSAVCTIPAILAHEVRPTPHAPVGNSTANSSNATFDHQLEPEQEPEPAGYTVEMNADVYGHLTFWINAVLCKLVPSVLLGLLSMMLVRRMRSADRRRMTLLRGQRPSISDSQQTEHRNRRTNRATSLLATIAILFAIVYFPQSALEILGAFSNRIKFEFYVHIGDVLDALSLINNGVTFMLHCAMSQQFRSTLMIVMIAPISKFKLQRTGSHRQSVISSTAQKSNC